MTGIRPWDLRPRVTIGKLPEPGPELGEPVNGPIEIYESKPIEITGLEKEHMKIPRNCGSCRFFHNAKRTLCKRYPPVAHGKREAFWPAVLWDDSCGEWEPRPRGEEGTS